MKTFIIILAVFLMLTTICYGAFTDKPGARPIGLGGAYVAIADDINSLFYNPAGLGRLYRTEITGVYDQQSVGLGVNLNYGYIGAIQPAGDLGIFGASVSQSYSELYREYIISLSYGTKITKKPLVYAGGNIKSLSKKYIENSYTQIDPLFLNNGYSKTGISFDIGILAYINKFWTLGAMLENVNSPDMALNSSSGEERVELNTKIGSSYKLGDWTPIAEVNIKNRKINGKQDINFLLGTEYKFSQNIDLRIGGNLNNLSTGASYNTENIQVDYALRYPITGVTGVYGSHSLQLTYKFGTSKIERPLTKVVLSLPSGVKRMAIAILDLSANNVSEMLSSTVAEFLRLEFFKLQRYDVVERQNIEIILKEQALQQTGCTSAKCAVELGRLLNVHYIIVGSLNRLGNQYAVNVRIVDVEKGRIVLSEVGECDSEEELPATTKGLVERINNQISVVGKVVSIEQDEIMIDKGSQDKLNEGDKVTVQSENKEGEMEITAEIQLIKVEKEKSRAKIIKKYKEIQINDIVNFEFVE